VRFWSAATLAVGSSVCAALGGLGGGLAEAEPPTTGVVFDQPGVPVDRARGCAIGDVRAVLRYGAAGGVGGGGQGGRGAHFGGGGGASSADVLAFGIQHRGVSAGGGGGSSLMSGDDVLCTPEVETGVSVGGGSVAISYHRGASPRHLCLSDD
jgi:hypothetical protein